MNERRSARSADPQHAVSMYLNSLCKRGAVEAVALATEDGTLVAGAGKLDVEWMGSVGASSRLSRLSWDGRVLHVRRLEVNDVPMCLTMAGDDVSDAPLAIRRILAN